MVESSLLVCGDLGLMNSLSFSVCRRWVWLLLAWAQQEDLRDGWGGDGRQRAGELQGAQHWLDDRLSLRRQLRWDCCADPSQEGR